jgi:ABC-2 type transport system permease protein
MSAVMLRRALLDLRWTTLWFAVGSALYLIVMISFYPTMQDNTQMLDDLLDLYPEALRQAFGIEDLTTFVGFVGAEFLTVMWPLILSVFLIMAGTATVAQEIERGTIELWLSVPVRRARLLGSKVLALGIGVASIIAVTIATMAIGAIAVDERLSLAGLLALFLTVFVFTLVVLGYSVLLSVVVGERGKAAGIAALITLASYLAWVVGGISTRWEWLRSLSIFGAYSPQSALRTGEIGWPGFLALLAVAGACVAAALWLFEHRDITP